MTRPGPLAPPFSGENRQQDTVMHIMDGAAGKRSVAVRGACSLICPPHELCALQIVCNTVRPPCEFPLGIEGPAARLSVSGGRPAAPPDGTSCDTSRF
jgi:hypothetical protein